MALIIERSASRIGCVSRLLAEKMRMSWLQPWRRDTKVPVANNAQNAVDERRIVPRISLAQAVTVRFTASGHYEFTVISRDISPSGIFLHADVLMKEGAQVEVVLTLPSQTSQLITVQVRGKVVRVEESFPTGIAIAFDRLVIAPDALEQVFCDNPHANATSGITQSELISTP
jgi:hypothetical protein